MKTLTIGSQSLVRVGLGCMGMSDFYGPTDEAECIRVIHHALDQGIQMLDTADMYGPWTNERLLGKALRDRREQAFLATKFGVVRQEDGAFMGIDGRPEYVLKSCDDSLKRLGVDHIDLYYQHRVDPQVDIEETVGAMARLVEAGKVRYLGLSEAHPNTLRRAHKVHAIAALQSEYSLWSRDPELGHLQACRELGVVCVAYSPLGRGFLTGKLPNPGALSDGDYRKTAPRMSGSNLAENQKFVDELGRLAKEHGCTTAQLALAWVLAQLPQIMAIPGTTKSHRIDENLAALTVSLGASELEKLNELAPLGVAAGERYDEYGMAIVNG